MYPYLRSLALISVARRDRRPAGASRTSASCEIIGISIGDARDPEFQMRAVQASPVYLDAIRWNAPAGPGFEVSCMYMIHQCRTYGGSSPVWWRRGYYSSTGYLGGSACLGVVAAAADHHARPQLPRMSGRLVVVVGARQPNH